ncbi:hypothetical protein DXN04_31960 [Chitinophaga silvisoli]|uniref:2'-5' RNA ligase family protein n=2 Tax=Chitinophaga silvisoli TaxID=2291814 RepID=A0A3E1NSN9_9BACT|nr:hypothetical protein DXN04_31960 [Chitinophaga silvisoli]
MRHRILSKFEVWADFRVSRKSEEEIFNFFRFECGLDPEVIVRNMHLTIYHSRRPMPAIQSVSQNCHLAVDTMDLKFMVMAPGGENPRPNLIPGRHKIGVRVHRRSAFRKKIYRYRQQLSIHETKRILGRRQQSNNSRSAFGARYFQPHITLLNAGADIDDDLTVLGDAFRNAIDTIVFDRFSVRVKQNY